MEKAKKGKPKSGYSLLVDHIFYDHPKMFLEIEKCLKELEKKEDVLLGKAIS